MGAVSNVQLHSDSQDVGCMLGGYIRKLCSPGKDPEVKNVGLCFRIVGAVSDHVAGDLCCQMLEPLELQPCPLDL